jgi:hypothetical protein
MKPKKWAKESLNWCRIPSHADAYIEEKVVGKTSLEDCRHIAMATIHKVDVLASWNFKHIVNLDRIKGYNAVNSLLGYSVLEIRSPKDLMNYGND